MSTSQDDKNSADGFAAVMPLYLSLYLVLLAIFILLSSFSTHEEVKARAVIGSLSASFPSLEILNRGSENPVVTEEDTVTIGFAVQDRLGKLFESAVPAAEYRILRQAREMEAYMPPETIYLPDLGDFRSISTSFLSQLAEILAITSGDERVEMIVYMPIQGGSALSSQNALSIARGARFVQTMYANGVPVQNILFSLENNNSQKMRLEFRILATKSADTSSEYAQ